VVDKGDRRSFSDGIGECVGRMDWFEDLSVSTVSRYVRGDVRHVDEC
jgi:hypothetical protein